MNLQTLSPLESAWQSLRVNLEWVDEFGLIFVFSSDMHAKEVLFRRADDLVRTQVRPFQRPLVRQASDLKDSLLPAAVNPSAAHLKARMPLWLDLDGYPGDSQWDRAREEFLYRLNERRASLMREHTRTVVLALPLDWTKRAAEAAPDLWTIRQPSVYLETGDLVIDGLIAQNAQPIASLNTSANALPRSVQHWQDGMARGAILTVWDAAEASRAALQAGHTAAALDIAQQAVALIRSAVASKGNSPERLRDLSVSLDNLGNIFQALGRLEDAQAAHAEAKRLRRALIEEFGSTPERLRDLSISLEKLGNVAQALGRLDEAQAAYAEGKKLSRALVEEFGSTPERLRDLSVSLYKLGSVALVLKHLEDAKTAYTEQISIAHALLDTYGDSVAGLESLAYGERGLGEVLQQGGADVAAQPHLQRALDLCQRLALAMPHEPRYTQSVQQLLEMQKAAIH